MFDAKMMRIRSFRTSQVSIGTTATAIRPIGFESYHIVKIKNLGSDVIYIGNSDSVSTSNGYPVAAGEEVQFFFSQPFQIYGVAGSAQNVAVMEYELETY